MNLGEILLPEYIDYYCVACSWMRIVTLKEKNNQVLTPEEQDLLTIIQPTTFVLPEPLLMAVRSLGNIVVDTDEHLYPEFPSLPTKTVSGQDGLYGSLETLPTRRKKRVIKKVISKRHIINNVFIPPPTSMTFNSLILAQKKMK